MSASSKNALSGSPESLSTESSESPPDASTLNLTDLPVSSAEEQVYAVKSVLQGS